MLDGSVLHVNSINRFNDNDLCKLKFINSTQYDFYSDRDLVKLNVDQDISTSDAYQISLKKGIAPNTANFLHVGFPYHQVYIRENIIKAQIYVTDALDSNSRNIQIEITQDENFTTHKQRKIKNLFSFKGSSGGPVLYKHADEHEYKLVGIVATGEDPSETIYCDIRGILNLLIKQDNLGNADYLNTINIIQDKWVTNGLEFNNSFSYGGGCTI